MLIVGVDMQSATITWTNGNGTNLWSDALNWSGGTVPGSGDVAVFDGTSVSNCSMDVNVNVLGVSITAAYTGTITQLAGVSITIGSSGYTQAGGVFSGGNSQIDINGTFAQSGGVFTATSGTMTIGRNYGSSNATIVNITGGTYNHNNGTVRLDPTTTGSRSLTVIPGAAQFYNIESDINNTTGTSYLLVQTGETLNVVNDFTHEDGSIRGLIGLQGDLIVGAEANEGSGWIVFSGMSTQTYRYLGAASRTVGFWIDKTSGSVNPLNPSSDFYISQYHQEQGVFNAPSGVLHIGYYRDASYTFFSYVSGTFNHNNGTVEFDPTTYYEKTLTAAINGLHLWDVIIDMNNSNINSHTYLAFPSGETLYVDNELIHNDGRLNGVVSLKGDLAIDSEAEEGNGWIIFDGTGTQTYGYSGSASRTAGFWIDKTSGSVNPLNPSSDFYISQYHQEQGVFNAPSGVLHIGYYRDASYTFFSYVSGTFNHNNGTVEFDPTTYYQKNLTAAINGLHLWDVIIDMNNSNINSHTYLTFPSGETLYVDNDLTHNDGRLSGVVSLKGDLVIDSEAEEGNGWIIFDGTGTQTYGYSGSASRTAGFWIDKTSGSVNPLNPSSDFYISQYHQEQGVFNAPSGVLHIGYYRDASYTLFSYVSGTFNHNNGTVEFDPTTYYQRTLTASTNGVHLWNVISDASNNNGSSHTHLTIPSGETLYVDNDLTHNDGRLSGVVSLKGDLTVDSEAAEGNGWIIFDGTGTQTYGYSGSASRTAGFWIDKTSGAVNPLNPSSDFYISQYHQEQGVFNAPSGVLHIGYYRDVSYTLFSYVSGTFNHNNGTVEFDPTTYYQRTLTVSAGGVHLWNVISDVSNNSGSSHTYLAIPSGETLYVDNDLTHNDGRLGGVVSLKGDLTVDSEAAEGNGWIIFDGTGTQTYGYSGSASRTAGFWIDKTSGSVNPLNPSSDFYISQYHQEQGVFNAPSGVLHIGFNRNDSYTFFSYVSGTFNHNNGTVEFDPVTYGPKTLTASTNGLHLWNVISDIGNGYINGHSYLSFPAGETLYVDNDFTHNDGRFSGIISLKGDLMVDSEAYEGDGWIVFDGTGIQTYGYSGSASRTAGFWIDKTSGSVNPLNPSTAYLISQYHQEQGVFNAPSALFRIGMYRDANWTVFDYVSGTFNHNNGRVEIDPTTYGNRTITVNSNSVVFYDVVIDVSNNYSSAHSALKIPSGQMMRVDRHVIHNDGRVTGLVALKGNLRVDNQAYEGNGWFIFNGTGNQTYYYSGAAVKTIGFWIDKTSGVVSPGNSSSDFYISRYRQDQGEFTAPSATLYIGYYNSGNITTFRYINGTFNHNNGTVMFNHSSYGLNTITIRPGDIHFNNVKVALSNVLPSVNSLMTVYTGDTLYCEGYFYQIDGRMSGNVAMEGDLDLSFPDAKGYWGWVSFRGPNSQVYHFDTSDPGRVTIECKKTAGVATPHFFNTDVDADRLVLRSGVFKGPSGELRLGQWITSGLPYLVEGTGGTYQHNNGKVILEGNISGKVSGTGGFYFYNLDINKSSNTLYVEDNLLVSNIFNMISSPTIDMGANTLATLHLNNTGLIKMANNGALVQFAGGQMVGSGTIEYNRTGLVTNGAYNVWSSPITSADILTIFPGANPCDVWTFEQSTQSWKRDWPVGYSTTCNGVSAVFQSWQVLNPSDGTPDGVMDVGRGYFIPGDIVQTKTFSGVSNNGPLAVPIVSTNLGDKPKWTGDDWNLVGNPYPCALDMAVFWAENSTNNARITDALYFWDDDMSGGSGYHHQDDYASWNQFGGTSSANSSQMPNGYLAGGQGFWVAAATSTNLVFNNSMRAIGNNDNYFKMGPKPGERKLWLRLYSDTLMSNQILMGVSPEATDGYDYNFDAHKMETDPSLILASKIDSGEYLIQVLSTLKKGESKRVPLKVKTKLNGKHVFAVDSVLNFYGENKVYIEDVQLGKTEELTNNGTYEVSLTKGTYEDRFYLVFTNELEEGGGKGTGSGNIDTSDVATGVEEVSEASRVRIYQDRDFIYVEKTGGTEGIKEIRLYDMVGKLLEEREGGMSMQRITISKYGKVSGIYILEYRLTDGSTSTERIPLITH